MFWFDEICFLVAWPGLSVTSFCAAFGINSILYQRGIYPPETFTRVTHYDMSLQLTTDSKLQAYLSNVVSQLKGNAGIWSPSSLSNVVPSVSSDHGAVLCCRVALWVHRAEACPGHYMSGDHWGPGEMAVWYWVWQVGQREQVSLHVSICVSKAFLFSSSSVCLKTHSCSCCVVQCPEGEVHQNHSGWDPLRHQTDHGHSDFSATSGDAMWVTLTSSFNTIL